MTAAETQRAIEAVWRIESAKIIAGLTRIVRALGLAEDLAQDALVAALQQWPESGVPDNPGAWLMATAKHRAIDHFRRNTMLARKREELGREPTDDELGGEIGIASGKVSHLKTVSIRPASLDAPISDDDSTEFGESVEDEEARTPFELLRDKDLHNDVDGLLEELDDREKKIISQRFGFDGGKRRTLEEIGKKLGVSRERIRQLENIALSKLRRALSQKEYPIGLPVAA